MSWAERGRLAREVIGAFGRSGTKCPWHSHGAGTTLTHASNSLCSATEAPDYAFEFVSSTLRYGVGVTAEIGQDLEKWAPKRVVVFTDPNVVKLRPFQTVAESLTKAKFQFDVFDRVLVEPSEASFREAIDFARAGKEKYQAFVAVGGGSTMDTAKAAALLAANPDNDLTDFIGVPFGRNLNPKNPMLPLICVPTTAGTGSETTAVSVLDLKDKHAKVAIRNRAIKPHLGLVDPLNIQDLPRHVTIYSGFDVLCHALESFTNLPYNERRPRPIHPANRPVYQGSNPISDVWVREALRIIRQYFRRAVADPGDMEARSEMLKASSFAGMGFGNAGVHLCHGLSYALSSLVRSFQSPDYAVGHPLVPHGLSVVLTAPADFNFTAPACPERHLEAANLLGREAGNDALADSGPILADIIRGFMADFGVPNGIKAVGFGSGDIPKLTSASLPTMQAMPVAPRKQTAEQIAKIYEESLTVY